jgi:hypothetical protein
MRGLPVRIAHGQVLELEELDGLGRAASATDERPARSWSRNEPWVVVTQEDDLVARELLAAVVPSGVVRRLNSTGMTDTSDLSPNLRTSSSSRRTSATIGIHLRIALTTSTAVDTVNCTSQLSSRTPTRWLTPTSPTFHRPSSARPRRANLSLDADNLPRDRPPFPIRFIFFTNRTNRKPMADWLRERDDLSILESAIMFWPARNPIEFPPSMSNHGSAGLRIERE